jgi:hypothetical protein
MQQLRVVLQSLSTEHAVSSAKGVMLLVVYETSSVIGHIPLLPGFLVLNQCNFNLSGISERLRIPSNDAT